MNQISVGLFNTIEFLAFVAVAYLNVALYAFFKKGDFKPLALFAWMSLGVLGVKWGVKLVFYLVTR